LNSKFAGKKPVKVDVVNGKRLKDTSAELSSSLEGKYWKASTDQAKSLGVNFLMMFCWDFI
jgi:hypothetical protein